MVRFTRALALLALGLVGSSLPSVQGAAQLAVPSVAPGAQPAPIQRRDTVLVTGSSTVFPFTEAVAMRFAEAQGKPKPFVDATGTVRGYNLFCQGTSLRYPDIANASRRINRTELSLCAARGVNEIIEIPIGHDGIVVATRRGAEPLRVTRAQLWLALAKEVPQGGQLVANPHTRWRQISPTLPDWPIEVLGPPATSGTRDSFAELALAAGCRGFAEVQAIADPARRRAVCTTVREDGRWIDAGEDDERIVARLLAAPAGHLQGIFGFSFLVAHADRLSGAEIDGVADSAETIASGRYPLARPLFVYVKRANLRAVPTLKPFLEAYLAAMEAGGYLQRIGLVPLPEAQLRQAREALARETILTRTTDG